MTIIFHIITVLFFTNAVLVSIRDLFKPFARNTLVNITCGVNVFNAVVSVALFLTRECGCFTLLHYEYIGV